jgi:hypothetical protein
MNKQRQSAESEDMRALFKMRRHHRGGRPKVFRVCIFCQNTLTAREMQGKCQARMDSGRKGECHGTW